MRLLPLLALGLVLTGCSANDDGDVNGGGALSDGPGGGSAGGADPLGGGVAGGSGPDGGGGGDSGPAENEPVPTGVSFFVAVDGDDANDCTAAKSSDTPKATFASAWECLTPGDALVVRDGTYDQDLSPPPGTAGSEEKVMIVQAEHDGAVHVTRPLYLRGGSYLAFLGMRISGDTNAIGVVSNGEGAVAHHIGFYRIGFDCSETVSDDACLALSDGTHHVLVQDAWGWGGGRYMALVYGGPGGDPPNTTCDFNTFRRVVLRQGPHESSGGNPQAGIAIYYGSNNLVENVIVIDSVPNSDSSNSAFYITGHSAPPETSGNRFFGDLALNNLGIGWYLDHNGIGSNNELRDSVIWGSESGVALYADGTCDDNVVDHVTVAANDAEGLWNGCDGTTITSSIFFDNGASGISPGSEGEITSEGWNLFFANADGPLSDGEPAATDLTVDPALAFVPRIESGSACSGAGEGGTDCGGGLRRRYLDGALTDTPLWPWPNQARIQQEMCSEAGETRGFCGAASLTEYVWSYLGNPVPASF